MSSAAPPPRRRSRRKTLSWIFFAIFLAPVLFAVGTLAYRGGPPHWGQYDHTVTSQLPAALAHPDARILVMSSRTRGWKGVVAVHSWVVIKGENERPGGAMTSPAGAIRCG